MKQESPYEPIPQTAAITEPVTVWQGYSAVVPRLFGGNWMAVEHAAQELARRRREVMRATPGLSGPAYMSNQMEHAQLSGAIMGMELFLNGGNVQQVIEEIAKRNMTGATMPVPLPGGDRVKERDWVNNAG